MTAWTTLADIRASLARDWGRGRLPAALLGAEAAFPRRLTLKGPGNRDLGQRFAAARDWIAALDHDCGRHGLRIEWREINHRQLGRNRLPAAVWLDDADTALALIGKTRQAARLQTLVETIGAAFPALTGWMRRHPLQVLEHDEEWPRLLAILTWFRDHPRPGVYLRQIDVEGVDTKFIERRRRLFIELLDAILPPDAIDPTATGAARFEQRYGLRSKPARIRFRLLDPSQYLHGLSDLTVTVDEFARLMPPTRRIVITENEINGLCLPNLPDTLVIFGLGYSLDLLAGITWLKDREIWYWGDIDTHGFAMLDQLRHTYRHTRSLLMDRATLLAHRPLWGHEERPTNRDLPHLTIEELALYDDLRYDHITPRLRLEQERIGFDWVRSAMWNAECNYST